MAVVHLVGISRSHASGSTPLNSAVSTSAKMAEAHLPPLLEPARCGCGGQRPWLVLADVLRYQSALFIWQSGRGSLPRETSAISAAELRQLTLFAGMDDGEIERLGGIVRAQIYERGEILIEYQSATSDVFLLFEGRLLANRFSGAGHEVGFRRMQPVCYFGELAAFDGSPRSVNIVALSTARVGRIAAADFKSLVAGTAGLANTLLIDMAYRIRDLSNRLYESTAISVPGRVEAELMRMALAQGLSGDNEIIDDMPTHAELATLIGGQRESVTRALGRLFDLGIVEKQGRGLVIRDFDALMDRTENADV
jgi:CRP/FNR family cyclic AMP-dependent transcriptional regulator